MTEEPKKINVKVEGEVNASANLIAENDKAREANFAQARAAATVSHEMNKKLSKAKKVEA